MKMSFKQIDINILTVVNLDRQFAQKNLNNQTEKNPADFKFCIAALASYCFCKDMQQYYLIVALAENVYYMLPKKYFWL